MSTLVNCIKCNKQVSSSAYKCPNCGENPQSIPCIFCGRLVSKDERVHIECAKRYSDLQQFSCPACHKVIAYEGYRSAYFSGKPTNGCPHCGHPFYICICNSCGKLVEISEAVSISSDSNNGENNVYTNYYHKSCHAIMLKEWEKHNQSHKTKSQTQSKTSFIEWCVALLILIVIVLIVWIKNK